MYTFATANIHVYINTIYTHTHINGCVLLPHPTPPLFSHVDFYGAKEQKQFVFKSPFN